MERSRLDPTPEWMSAQALASPTDRPRSKRTSGASEKPPDPGRLQNGVGDGTTSNSLRRGAVARGLEGLTFL